MKENAYNDPLFFQKYSQMPRSILGLEGAGEWYELQKLLPDFTDTRVLDLGLRLWLALRLRLPTWGPLCAGHRPVGADAGYRPGEESRSPDRIPPQRHGGSDLPRWKLRRGAQLPGPPLRTGLSAPCRTHRPGGWCPGESWSFLWNTRSSQPTASQDWYYGPDGEILHFPVDRYYYEGERDAVFLGEHMVKYHRTLDHLPGHPAELRVPPAPHRRAPAPRRA